MESDGFIPKSIEDDTKYRVIGSTNYPLGTSENYQYFISHVVMASLRTKQTLSPRLVLRLNWQSKKYLIFNLAFATNSGRNLIRTKKEIRRRT